ncbi:hypothetical protein HOG21_06715 [bacterium]|nr:hypothetical protein [bacterium]
MSKSNSNLGSIHIQSIHVSVFHVNHLATVYFRDDQSIYGLITCTDHFQ